MIAKPVAGRNGHPYTEAMIKPLPFSPAERAILDATGVAGHGPECVVDVTCPRCGRKDQYAFPRQVADILLVGTKHRGYAAAAEYLNTVADAAARVHAPECPVGN